MATVPARLIKWKNIDFNGEILDCLGNPSRIAGIDVTPPSMGVFSLLELIDSLFVKDFQNSTEMDFYRAFYLAVHKSDCLQIVAGSIEGLKENKFRQNDPATWTRLDRAVVRFSEKHSAELDDMLDFHSLLMKNTFNGWEMIPDSANEIRPWMPFLFGAESLAGVAKIAGKLNVSMHEVVWDVPLCLIGHISASEARANGVKGINRPKDIEDTKAKLKEAREREKTGVLHPWQVEEPHLYSLEAIQLKNSPEIQEKYNVALFDFYERERLKKEKANG